MPRQPSDARPAPTNKDVARLAGVSPSSASMALADHPRVAEATKEAVRRAAAQLNYVPNSAGRALRAQRVGAIALVVPASSAHVFSHPFFMAVLQGITSVANDHDLALMLSTAAGEAGENEAEAYLRILRGRRADGVIVAAAAMADRNVAQLISSGYPVCVIGRTPDDPDVVSVGVDDRGGAERATLHLLREHGLRRVAHVTGPLDHRSAADKLEGYRAALSHELVPYDERLVARGDYSQESGFAACTALLDSGTRFDGLFAANDEMALGALEALRSAGVTVPGDVALVGFDDVGLARVAYPRLSTVRQPMVEVGQRAAERLVALLDGRAPAPRHLELPTEVVVRDSCGCR